MFDPQKNSGLSLRDQLEVVLGVGHITWVNCPSERLWGGSELTLNLRKPGVLKSAQIGLTNLPVKNVTTAATR
jgi:hypothetical protein